LRKKDLITFFSENDDDNEEIKEGQFSELLNIPTGMYIFNIESQPCTIGKLIRAGGSKAKFIRKYNKYGLISLPSGEKKLLLLSCYATVGRPSNSLYLFKKYYKAGNSR